MIANILHTFFRDRIFVPCKPEVKVPIFENCV